MKKRIIIGACVLLITVASSLTSSAHSNLSSSGKHNILSTQLPDPLLKDVKKDYAGYWITRLYEEGSVKRPSYFITVENADQIISMSSDDAENWVVTNTTLKDN
jgi:hypothetical protein